MGLDKSTGFNVITSTSSDAGMSKANSIDWSYTVFLINGVPTRDEQVIQTYMQSQGITEKSDLELAYLESNNGLRNYSVKGESISDIRDEAEITGENPFSPGNGKWGANINDTATQQIGQ